MSKVNRCICRGCAECGHDHCESVVSKPNTRCAPCAAAELEALAEDADLNMGIDNYDGDVGNR